ncbi:MAG: NAD(P)H-hydrate dehydratase [Chitinophagaceae bacterium]|nr:NAD(P)H-hydrate dehydratase [Chitinophagaceae bacterium]
MKIFTSQQIRQWDAYTIAHEPIASIDLMERAARACYDWLVKNEFQERQIHVFCGRGNNGGDGLALARLIKTGNGHVTVYIPRSDDPGSPDFQINLHRFHECGGNVHIIHTHEILPVIHHHDLVIDALFGTGLNKPPEGICAALINYMSQVGAPVISIDIPSGLYADQCSKKNSIVTADHTLSFQQYKLAFFFSENERYLGQVHLLDIGLHPGFEEREEAQIETVEKELIQKIRRPRKKFSHKGSFGHAALLAGSKGMMGAAVLSARSCLRSGVGKLTCFIPDCGYTVLQSTVPEAMCRTCGSDHLDIPSLLGPYQSVGIGPGISLQDNSAGLLSRVFAQFDQPMVLDADALNILAADRSLMASIPRHSILTPHPGEFDRLFGPIHSECERLQSALLRASEGHVYIVLKGHHSFIATPDGKGYLNCTGNPGMATAGSGDVLTGILTGLLAQGYPPLQAALMGVYLHGSAGDIAVKDSSPEAMIAGDIIGKLGAAFKLLD